MSDWSILGAREFAVGNYIVQKVYHFKACIRQSVFLVMFVVLLWVCIHTRQIEKYAWPRGG